MVSVDTNTDTAGTMCTPAPLHFSTGSLEPNTPVLNPQDLVFATTNNPVQPTASTADLWKKVVRKAAKIAVQHKYYGMVLQMPVPTQSRVQSVTTISLTVLNSTIPVITPAYILTLTLAPIPTYVPIAARTPAPAPTIVYPNIDTMTGAMTVIKVMTVELHKTTQHESEESEESDSMGRDRISKNKNTENIEKGE